MRLSGFVEVLYVQGQMKMPKQIALYESVQMFLKLRGLCTAVRGLPEAFFSEDAVEPFSSFFL